MLVENDYSATVLKNMTSYSGPAQQMEQGMQQHFHPAFLHFCSLFFSFLFYFFFLQIKSKQVHNFPLSHISLWLTTCSFAT